MKKIGVEVAENRLVIQASDEDIHSAIERRVVELLPELGSVIRTGRSRNDLVATDFKLYIMESMNSVAISLSQLGLTINEQALSMV
ncbi:MAG: lyase family protein, partial [Candidatus Fonsibacter sp.]